MADTVNEDKDTITTTGDDLVEPQEDKNETVAEPEEPVITEDKTVDTGVDDSKDDAIVDNGTVVVEDNDRAGEKTEAKKPSLEGRKPSFKSLRQEHDMLLFTRSLLLIIAAIALLIPIPFSYVGLKFVLFVFVSYAAIYNEISIGEEAKLRKDKTSARAHGLAYIAFGAVTVLFFVLAVRAGIAASTIQDALQQCLEALKNAGIPAIIVK